MREHNLSVSNRDWRTALVVASEPDQELIEWPRNPHARVHRAWRGERAPYTIFAVSPQMGRLCVQMLVLAIMDTRKDAHRSDRASMLRWVFDGGDEFLSFDWVCDAVGLSAAAIRAHISVTCVAGEPKSRVRKARRRQGYSRETDIVSESRYPWDRWFDGQTWMLTRGHDFLCSKEYFRSYVYRAAERRHRYVWVELDRRQDTVTVKAMGEFVPEYSASDVPTEAMEG